MPIEIEVTRLNSDDPYPTLVTLNTKTRNWNVHTEESKSNVTHVLFGPSRSDKAQKQELQKLKAVTRVRHCETISNA